MNVTLKQIDVPRCDGGAPCPVIMANEGKLVFGYFNAGIDDATIITVRDCSIFKFGAPNDEALSGHRYARCGLGYYAACEVLNSEWVDELMVANRVHSRHDDDLFKSCRHFVFTFHDSTLEFISDGFSTHTVDDNLAYQVALAFDKAAA